MRAVRDVDRQPGISDALPLFRKMQEALGGADTIAAIRDFEQQVRAESWDGNTGRSLGEVRKLTRWVRPNYLRVDQVSPGSKRRQPRSRSRIQLIQTRATR